MVTIIPAILATTEEEFSKQLEKIKSSADLEGGWVHIDFMDGQLVETKSLELEVLQKFDIPFKKEAHLMAKHPHKLIDQAFEQKFERILIHFESEPKVEDPHPPKNQITSHLNYIEDHGLHLKETGVENGLVVNPETSIDEIKPYLSHLDVLQIMGVVPGAQGHGFIEETIEKVKQAATLRGELGLNFQISVDGGVSDENAKELMNVGADILVIGSYLQKGDVDESLEKIWEVTR